MTNTPDLIKVFVSMLSVQLPTMIVCLAACVVILTKWDAGSRGLLWALLGFGSVLVLSLVFPVVYTIVQSWAIHSGQIASRMWALTMLSVVSSVLHAVAYVFFLIAVLAGRPAPDAANPPPCTPQR